MTKTPGHVQATLADALLDDPEAGESQVPEPGDYLTVHMGRQPVVVTGDEDGELHRLGNACALSSSSLMAGGSETATSWPSADRRSPMERPMPRAAPVTWQQQQMS